MLDLNIESVASLLGMPVTTIVIVWLWLQLKFVSKKRLSRKLDPIINDIKFINDARTLDAFDLNKRMNSFEYKLQDVQSSIDLSISKLVGVVESLNEKANDNKRTTKEILDKVDSLSNKVSGITAVVTAIIPDINLN
jgi:hypothetical protein